VSRLKQELNQVGNANFWPGPIAPLGKATTYIEKKIKYLVDKSRGYYKWDSQQGRNVIGGFGNQTSHHYV